MTPTDPTTLTDALVRVAERSFFAWAEPIPVPDVDTHGWRHASVGFHGDFHGRMTFSLPDPLARDLYAAFLGLPPDEAVEEEPLRDLIGEFANMACGSWLTQVHGAHCFSLDEPDAAAPAPAGVPAAAAMVNDRPVLITLALEGPLW